MSKTIEMIKRYIPYNEQEEIDKQLFIDCENVFGQILTRDNNFCHLCSAAFVINKDRTKTLCIYHNIFKSWTFPSGHADGDDDMLYVAEKELKEETSITNYKLLLNEPISIDSLGMFSHYKRGEFVNAHIHLNTTYLFEADENQEIKIKEDENSNIEWLTFDELINKSTEPHMIYIFKKIVERIKELDK